MLCVIVPLQMFLLVIILINERGVSAVLEEIQLILTTHLRWGYGLQIFAIIDIELFYYCGRYTQ